MRASRLQGQSTDECLSHRVRPKSARGRQARGHFEKGLTDGGGRRSENGVNETGRD